ncbi:CDC50/LEM3 family protein [Cyberlindnera jadinii NRRL Y-1542]|uniref:Membrane protein of the plasma membrane and ER n=1 Tax=Cyberlindnera jadinii (strain ATCC 18201 / CBS 1600 / BCRC 20928 / JCM 3617 / NBRC 0987 / NRRL Y-1542) TaxID=983966 RepID=A0A1E4S925_CYBJN|nr:membrane protein of the plasma membrane and ER [Cyberlindnera jadinii NRRL Y-1542]ODV75973.1 membrane protein of the plasma membrane and ER [Cyberlindnera jadinii NRRL Y-1542]
MLKARNIFKRPERPVEPESDTDSISDEEIDVVKEKTRRPKENNFTQQKLKAFHPIITPKYVIPIFVCLAVFLIPLGAAMLYGSNQVEELLLYYNDCEELANFDYFTDMPSDKYEAHFHDAVTIVPKWRYVVNESETDTAEQGTCELQFQIPDDIGPAVYYLYKVENFYANHRRYARSYSEDQLNGDAASLSTIKDTVGQNCDPLSQNDDGVKYYPCGLIANAMFNDTFSSLSGVNDTTTDYEMTTEGIAWSTNHNRFKKTKYNASEVVPPPNWAKMYPDGYTEENMPDISTWQEFQNWMQAPGLPTFSKMVMRNDDDVLPSGTYQVTVGMHWPVNEFNGKKAVYLTTRSVIGGRNPFLGICWIVVGVICLVVGLGFLVVHFLFRRKLGDVSKLSWNKDQ